MSVGSGYMRSNIKIEIIDSGHFQVDSINTETLELMFFGPGIEVRISIKKKKVVPASGHLSVGSGYAIKQRD